MWEFAFAAATNILGGMAQRGAAIDQMNAASRVENDAIERYNMSQVVRNNYRAGLLNLQLGQARKRNAQAGADLSAQGAQIRGAQEAVISASDTTGASVDSIRQDIRMRLDQSELARVDDFYTTMENYNAELGALRMNALDSVVQAKQSNYVGPDTGDIVAGGLLSAGARYASNYARQRMALDPGLGTPVPKSTPSLLPTTMHPFDTGYDLGSGMQRFRGGNPWY